MPGPRDPFTNLTQQSVAEDFMSARKRLREARIRWIEENEMPEAYSVEGPDGKAFATPFQVGKRKYEGEYPKTAAAAFKPSFKPPAPDNPDATKDLDKLDNLIREAEAFMGPGIYRESAHPDIREGEDYGEYCARVGRAYEQAAGAGAVRRPVPDTDSVREPAAIDPGGDGGASPLGAGDRGSTGPDLRGSDAPEPDPGTGAGPAGAAAATTDAGSSAAAWPDPAGGSTPDADER